MSRMKFTFLAIAGFALQACNTSFHDLGIPPATTPIDHRAPIADVLIQPEPEVINAPERLAMADTSLFKEKSSLLFRDTRAFEVGDILTVDISINDSAKLDNSSSRNSEIGGSLGASTNLTLDGNNVLPDLGASGNLDGNLDVAREGSVDRTERINLQIAAVVSQASANGNLRIIGSQEVRVNHEIRILTVEGVVRTKDIRPDNTIPYEKIAEARITYGGHNQYRVKKPRKWRAPSLFNKNNVLSMLNEG